MIQVDNPANPRLIDKAIIDVNAKLNISLFWLTHAFGNVQSLIRENDQKQKVKYPAIFTGIKDKYHPMFPDHRLGNFSYWEIDSDYDIEEMEGEEPIITTDFGLIFWMDLNKVLATEELRNLEAVKEQVIKFFRDFGSQEVSLTIESITEKADKIYEGYTHDEIESQFLMNPFAGFRVNGTIEYQSMCESESVPVTGGFPYTFPYKLS